MVFEASFVDKIWGFFPTFRHYKFRAEVVGGSFEVSKGELSKGRDPTTWGGARGSSSGGGAGLLVMQRWWG